QKPQLAYRPLEEHERDEKDDDHDEDLETANDDWPRPFDLTDQREIVGRLELRGPRAKEGQPLQDRLNDREHNAGERAERQPQRAEQIVEARPSRACEAT